MLFRRNVMTKLWILWLVAGIVWFARADEERQADLRQYSEGPLTPADYKAAIPARLPRAGDLQLQAFTWTVLDYKARYDAKRQGAMVVATLSEFKAIASVDRAASWNARPRDRRLLAHEQGHFDLARIAALEVNATIERLRRDGKLPSGQGRTKAEALADLRRKLDELMRDRNAAAGEAHREYDRFTNYGNIGSAQAESRRSQLRRIEELTKELQERDPLFAP